jgi:pseudouridylate synthase
MPAPAFVALETTLLLHGVPADAAKLLADRLSRIIRDHGAIPRLVGIVNGRPIVGMTDDQLDVLLATRDTVKKVNTANAGIALFRGRHAATTVSTTMEFAARAGLHVFATGGIGGVHKFLPTAHSPRTTASPFDVSADLTALTRFPIAVVASGVKSILDVAATREVLETLGVPVIGFRTDVFPEFYLRGMGLPAHVSAASAEGLSSASPTRPVSPVDYNFTDVAELARFVRFELARTGRGILICNPIPAEHELKREDWNRWLAAAEQRVASSASSGRDATPALLGALHELSGGATLKANIELVCSNASLAAQIAAAMTQS